MALAEENIARLTKTVQYKDGRQEVGESNVIREHILTVIVNEIPALRLICTKSDLKELVVGRLVTEGLIESPKDIYKIYFCKYENEASVFLHKEVPLEETLHTELSCCSNNRTFVALAKENDATEIPQFPRASWEKDWIFHLAAEFEKGTEIHKSTHATHSCILAKGKDVLFTCEDIGRHNAVDKAVGYAFLNQIPTSDCILFTSGRVPLDMVEKVIAAGIPVLVSKSVPTMESVELARQAGLTLICRAWSDCFEVFSP